jgi:hypothetical protein
MEAAKAQINQLKRELSAIGKLGIRVKVLRLPRRADEQKCHRRLRPLGELAQHNETSGSKGTVNGTVAAGQFTFLSGEVCKVAVLGAMGV